jgi:branched-chain amino acid transport system ATP-binding protein
MLEVSNLSKRFRGIRALANVSFQAAEGEVLGLVGPNGAGKSTLVNCITGQFRADSGVVMWSGENITSMPAHILCRKGVTRTFQHTRLFPELTVQENVEVGATLHARSGLLRSSFYSPRVRRDSRAVKQAASDALDVIGWNGSRNARAGAVSTGNKRLVALARALASGPRLVFLDEPAAGLNDEETAELAVRLQSLAANGFGIVVIDHDVQFIFNIARRVLVLAEGRVIAEGPAAEIQTDPIVIEAYLGSAA